MSPKPYVFISYARKDGADEAERLYTELRQQSIDAWRDQRDLDPYAGFDAEIEQALEAATHVVVCITPDVKREKSFVRLEIAYALANNKPIIPLLFPNGHRPITIINHTYIDFADWNTGFPALLERLKRFEVEEIDPRTRRERELAYLQRVGQQYDHWRDLYTDLAASAPVEKQRVKLKAAAARYLEMQHDIWQTISHEPDEDKSKTITVESFDELREGILKYRRVALIGDPGAGKTTTLERLAYELASTAAEDEDAALPLYARLGAYGGGGLDAFLESQFGGLRLRDYVPGRVFLLLDGLNEMPSEYHEAVDRWLHANPEAQVIVSCRKLDYVGLKLPLQRVDITPLDVNRIHLFIGNYLDDDDRERLFWSLGGKLTVAAWDWYRQQNEEATFADFWFGTDEPGFNWDVERKHLDVARAALRESGALPDMLGVVSNPFLLFITVQIYYRQGGQPPRNKGQLFDQFVTLLLEKRGKPAAVTHPPWIDEAVQRKGLTALAYRMLADPSKGTSVDETWAQAVIREALPGQDADQLLYLAVSASLIERGKNVRFVHQLLQEYFAAVEVGEDVRRGVPATKYWPDQAWWKPTGWEEMALFLAGMEGDATRVVRWLTPVQPTLAYRCATESGSTCDEAVLSPLLYPAQGARRCPIACAEGGRRTAAAGDSRPGVGLLADGLPDIAWGKAVPAGTYTIGGDEQAVNPLPEQQSAIKHPYQLARYPVTYVQFQAFLDARDGFEDDRWWVGLTEQYRKQAMVEQYFKYTNHPRESVSWYQAVAFCRWLTAKYRGAGLLPEGQVIRLPTEQEWEIAARVPDGRKFPWGDTYVPGHANLDETDPNDPVGPYWLRQTTAVGLYPQGRQEELELDDLAGNVWEWCLNEFDDPERTQIAGSERRVLRGGSWPNDVPNARCASRDWDFPDDWSSDCGFRGVVGVPIS